MKLSQDADARARLRMLRMWLTPEQYREICAGLEQVEAAPRQSLRLRIEGALHQARTLAVACLRKVMGMLARPAVAQAGRSTAPNDLR